MANKSIDKLIAYYYPVITADFFNFWMSTTRAKYEIPSKGYTSKDGKYSKTPEEWVKGPGKGRRAKLHEEIVKFLDENDLYKYYWYIPVRSILFYDDFNLEDVRFNIVNLKWLADLYEDIGKGGKTEKETIESRELSDQMLGEEFSRVKDIFPILIGISPYVTERDLLKYVKENYKYIKPTLDKLRKPSVDIDKKRTLNKKILDRNKLIYKHRGGSAKEIVKILTTAGYEPLDEGHIHKIISLERKRHNPENK